MNHDERHDLIDRWLDKAELRLRAIEHRLEMEDLALTGLRWAVSIAGGTAIIVAVQRILA